MIKIDLKRHRKEIIGSVVVLLILLGGMSVFKYTSFNSGFEIVDDLGGNIFPSDRKSTRLNSSHRSQSRMPSSA